MNILFTIVCLNSAPMDQLKLLIDSTKRKFLKNHNVDIKMFSNIHITYPGTETLIIKIDENIKNENYYQLHKVLALNHINLDAYDYVFVSDIDQMFINTVNDDDLLLNKLCIMEHFYKDLRTADNMRHWSDVITFVDREYKHTMGNFYGGPVHIIKDFLQYVNGYWQEYKNHVFPPVGFFSKYPEEVLLIKYIKEKNLSEHRIPCSINFINPAFMTNINAFGNLYEHLDSFKLIHNIKIDMEGAQKLYKLRCEP